MKNRSLLLFTLLMSLCLFNITFAENKLPLLSKVIYLDSGHGGVDSGAFYKNIKESDINLEITKKIEQLHAKGVDTVCCPDEKGQIDLKKLMTYLGNEGIDSILLEGGGTLNDSALRAGIVKEVHCFIAPKLFGGKNSKTPVEGIGIGLPSEALKLKCTDICRIGEDIRIICQVCEKEQEGPCLQES